MHTSDETLLLPEQPLPPSAPKSGGKKKKKHRGAFGRFLRRTLLLLFTWFLVAAAGSALLLNTLFNGPSPTVRNLLTATLYENSLTRWIPELFLEPSLLDQILLRDTGLPESAVSDPTLIRVLPEEQEWLDCPDGIRPVQRRTDTLTAHLLLIRDPDRLSRISGQDISHVLESQHSPAATNGGDGNCFAGFTEDGILVLASSFTDVQHREIKIRAGGPCDQILIFDGTVNHTVYSANTGIAPRSALGQRADGTVIFLYLPGGTCRDLTDALVEYGAVNGCSLEIGEACALHYLDTWGRFSDPSQLPAFGTGVSPDSPSAPEFWVVRSSQEG